MTEEAAEKAKLVEDITGQHLDYWDNTGKPGYITDRLRVNVGRAVNAGVRSYADFREWQRNLPPFSFTRTGQTRRP